MANSLSESFASSGSMSLGIFSASFGFAPSSAERRTVTASSSVSTIVRSRVNISLLAWRAAWSKTCSNCWVPISASKTPSRIGRAETSCGGPAFETSAASSRATACLTASSSSTAVDALREGVLVDDLLAQVERDPADEQQQGTDRRSARS